MKAKIIYPAHYLRPKPRPPTGYLVLWGIMAFGALVGSLNFSTLP